MRSPLKEPGPPSLYLSVDALRAEIEQLYRERFVGFRNGVATVTGDYESARDAVQEGFARALRSAAQFRGEGSLEGWLWRIVFRVALEQHRDEARLPFDEIEVDFVEPERDPALAKALSGLPPRRRLIVFLRYFADLDYATIAEVCEIEEGTVAATLAQARQALASILDEEGVRR